MASLRFTNAIRDQIIDRILADIPSTDFAKLGREEITQAAIDNLPSAVRKVWDNQELRGFCNVEHIYADGGGLGAALPAPSNRADIKRHLPADAWAVFNKRRDQDREQKEARSEMRRALKVQLQAIRTAAEFEQQFPALARYAPSAPEDVVNLPASTALVDMLVKAGLPTAREDA